MCAHDQLIFEIDFGSDCLDLFCSTEVGLKLTPKPKEPEPACLRSTGTTPHQTLTLTLALTLTVLVADDRGDDTHTEPFWPPTIVTECVL